MRGHQVWTEASVGACSATDRALARTGGCVCEKMRLMRPPPVFNRRGRLIESVCDWGEWAPAASTQHWKDGRSAKELAKAWMAGSGPAVLTGLFESQVETAALVIESAVAEAQVAFDDYPGGRRNHDLLIKGQVAGGPIVIGLKPRPTRHSARPSAPTKLGR